MEIFSDDEQLWECRAWVVQGREGSSSLVGLLATVPAGRLYVDTQQAGRRLALALNDLSMSEDGGVDGIVWGRK